MRTIQSSAPQQPHVLCGQSAPPSEKRCLEGRLQDGMSVPGPNQELQNITATQHVLFYKETNLSTSQPFPSPAALVQPFARLCCKPSKRTPGTQHTA